MSEKESSSSGLGAPVGLLILTFGAFSITYNCSEKNKALKKYHNIIPTNAHTEYVNKDSLSDLVYKTGEIFLQTKEGSFVSYDSIINQEKRMIDSLYRAKQDSIKNIYTKKGETK